jgi:hypothetical protein
MRKERSGADMMNRISLKKYDGSSKLMEATGLVTLLSRMPEEKGASVCILISDDDSNARARAQHACDGGVLPDHVNLPSFLLIRPTESGSLPITFTI